MSKTKKILSLVLALFMMMNIFSVCVQAEGDKADYSSLVSYIEKNVPQNNDAGIYSQDSYGAVVNILNSIDYDLPPSVQSTVDGYLSDLQSAVASLVSDESKAVAQFGLTLSSETLHPGDTVQATLSLNTNYGVISAGAVIVYDSTVFELLGGTSISSAVDISGGCMSAYKITGSTTGTNTIFASRNSNTSYWNSENVKQQFKAVNIGLSLNSKVVDPVFASGKIASLNFKVLNDVEFGTSGKIFMSSDFNKTTDFSGGLNYASRSVGEKMGPASSCVAAGQTIDLAQADKTANVSHTLAVDSAVEPTCTQAGLTQGSHCSVCNAIIVAQETVEALGHNWDEGTMTTEVTCTEDGVRTFTCSRCGATKTETIAKLGHSYTNTVVVSPKCTEDGYTRHTCIRCGDYYDDRITGQLGHRWDNGQVTLEPTCTEDGVRTFTCKRDSSHTKTEVIEALGHTAGELVIVTPATCTATGLKEKHCTVCNALLESEVIEMVAHTEDAGTITTAPTCTETGVKTYKCTVCDTVLRTEEVAVLGHNYDSVVTAPTCTEGGYTTHTCLRCNDTYTDAPLAALGHDWDEGTVTVAPTSTEKGSKTFRCSRCDATRTEEIEALAMAELLPVEGSGVIFDNDAKLIYGLSTYLDSDTILSGVYASGADASIEIDETENGFGTGTVVRLVQNGETVDTYTIIIRGDATGDGVVDELDSVLISMYNAWLIDVEDNSPVFFGMDSSGDGVVDEFDLVIVDLVVGWIGEINQTTGEFVSY